MSQSPTDSSGHGAKMSAEEMVRLCKQHSVYTWSAGDAVNPLPIERAEGVFMYGPNGERYYDFNSQLMSVNIGHGHPKVKAAMKEQIDQLLYVFPGTATEVRARVSAKLAGLVPAAATSWLAQCASVVPERGTHTCIMHLAATAPAAGV